MRIVNAEEVVGWDMRRGCLFWSGSYGGDRILGVEPYIVVRWGGRGGGGGSVRRTLAFASTG